MKIIITLLALAFAVNTNAQLAPVFRCTGVVMSPEKFEVVGLEFTSGGAAINDYMYGETKDYYFLGFIGGDVESAEYQGSEFTMAIFSRAQAATLIEKKVVLYSNTLVQMIKAQEDGVSTSLSCARYQ